MNQVLHIHFRTHVCFAWLFQFLFFRILVVIKNLVGGFSIYVNEIELVTHFELKKSGADYWNFHMKRQYAICVSQKRLPMQCPCCTVLDCVVTQWDLILSKVVFELLYSSPTSKIEMKYIFSFFQGFSSEKKIRWLASFVIR